MPPYEVMGGRPTGAEAPLIESLAGTARPPLAQSDAGGPNPDRVGPVEALESSASPRGGAASAARSGDTVDVDAPPRRRTGILLGSGRRSSAAPIVLRLPPGYVVLFILAMVGLIVLAFWVGRHLGHASGYRRGYDTHRAEFEVRPGRGNFNEPPALRRAPDTGANAGVDSSLGNGTGGAGVETTTDRRVVGLNYWVLSQVPPDEADRICRFLRENGVDSFIRPLDTKGLCHVIALPGFKRVDEALGFKGELRQLGLTWKSEFGGTDAFLTMYAEKYKAPEAPQAAGDTAAAGNRRMNQP